MTTQHKLKILNCYYEAVVSGDKCFEIRYNGDRGFQKGDYIELVEISPAVNEDKETGRRILARITYVTNFNQRKDWVVFGFDEIEILGG